MPQINNKCEFYFLLIFLFVLFVKWSFMDSSNIGQNKVWKQSCSLLSLNFNIFRYYY